MTRTRSRSLSTEVPLLPTPIPLKAPQSATANTSSLSASLRAFSALSLSPPTTLDSEEFQKAYHHVRSSSFSSGAQRPSFIHMPDEPSLNAQLPGMSTSPTSAISDSPPTPPLSTSPKSAPAIGLGKPRATSIKSSGLDGVCEKEELEFDDLGGEAGAALRAGMPESAPAAPSPFANGARWGWPQASTAGALSSSPPQASHVRRASLGGPATMMAPLGRVVSAGAAPVSSGKGNDGLGLFRRLSVGGFGSRPKPPSPPSSNFGGAAPAPSAPSAPVAPAPAPVAAPSPIPEERTGRGRSSGGSKPKKRGVSPFGERMLRGFGHT